VTDIEDGTASPEQGQSATPAMALKLTDLAVGYGTQAVVRSINMDVAAGTITALLGRNGAGKTTILNTIAGVIPALRGDMWASGQRLVGPLHKRVISHRLGLVTEDRAVIRRLSVAENLRVGRGDAARAYELFPELVPLRKRKAGLLSGGEQQMLALGRCISVQPRLLLVDELSFGLAPLVVQRLLGALSQISKEAGVAVILVEQHPNLALSVADHGHVISRGEIRVTGTGKDLMGRLDEIERTYLSDVS
jgi:branched-chain amino acid transport system ATP-binding protein